MSATPVNVWTSGEPVHSSSAPHHALIADAWRGWPLQSNPLGALQADELDFSSVGSCCHKTQCLAQDTKAPLQAHQTSADAA